MQCIKKKSNIYFLYVLHLPVADNIWYNIYMIHVGFFFWIGKQRKYVKSAWKRHTKYTQSIQVAAKYKQRKERTNQHPNWKTSP